MPRKGSSAKAASNDPSIAPSVLASVSIPVAAPASATPARSRSPSAVKRNPERIAPGAMRKAQSAAARHAEPGGTPASASARNSKAQ
jgi:hypothetical protein